MTDKQAEIIEKRLSDFHAMNPVNLENSGSVTIENLVQDGIDPEEKEEEPSGPIETEYVWAPYIPLYEDSIQIRFRRVMRKYWDEHPYKEHLRSYRILREEYE